MLKTQATWSHYFREDKSGTERLRDLSKVAGLHVYNPLCEDIMRG